jgi:prepilin-type N-terminal cleavage/methylation domain-containing protein
MRAALLSVPSLRTGFTLIELLVVMTIIILLAAVVLPNLGAFKPNITASAERQMLDALGRARQLAISQRTTAYLVFIPTNFWNDAIYTSKLVNYPVETNKAFKLMNKQLTGYNIVTLRSLGDQPGQKTPRFFGAWQNLPDGSFIPLEKFQPRTAIPVMTITNAIIPFSIYGFYSTTNVPFPSAQVAALGFGPPYVTLPFVAFNYQGQLVDAGGSPTGMDELIPLAKGAVSYARNTDRTIKGGNATIIEQPAGNATNSFDLVRVDWLTGRAHVERLEVR